MLAGGDAADALALVRADAEARLEFERVIADDLSGTDAATALERRTTAAPVVEPMAPAERSRLQRLAFARGDVDRQGDPRSALRALTAERERVDRAEAAVDRAIGHVLEWHARRRALEREHDGEPALASAADGPPAVAAVRSLALRIRSWSRRRRALAATALGAVVAVVAGSVVAAGMLHRDALAVFDRAPTEQDELPARIASNYFPPSGELNRESRLLGEIDGDPVYGVLVQQTLRLGGEEEEYAYVCLIFDGPADSFPNCVSRIQFRAAGVSVMMGGSSPADEWGIYWHPDGELERYGAPAE